MSHVKQDAGRRLAPTAAPLIVRALQLLPLRPLKRSLLCVSRPGRAPPAAAPIFRGPCPETEAAFGAQGIG